MKEASGRQCIRVCHQRRPLLPRHSTMRDKRSQLQHVEVHYDHIKVFRVFGQD